MCGYGTGNACVAELQVSSNQLLATDIQTQQLISTATSPARMNLRRATRRTGRKSSIARPAIIVRLYNESRPKSRRSFNEGGRSLLQSRGSMIKLSYNCDRCYTTLFTIYFTIYDLLWESLQQRSGIKNANSESRRLVRRSLSKGGSFSGGGWTML